MPNEDDGTAIARRIIELSDRISEHSRKITQPGFVPTPEFLEETRRLTELCRSLIIEAATRQKGLQDDPESK
jgi:hypothetical protein